MKRMNRSQVIRSLVEHYDDSDEVSENASNKKKSSKRRENQVSRALRRGEIQERREPRSSTYDDYED